MDSIDGDKNTVGGSGDSTVMSVAEPARPTKVPRSVSSKEFATAKLYRTFEEHVKYAQDAFLSGDPAKAEREATLALRLRPTAHLFALLAVVAESRGQFDRASDFRLLQAFLARDAALWEELLHDFLDQQLYYKSVVCLQRLSALERKDAQRYRALQLQLADLLIGLGEIRRATHVLEPLWSSSRYRDFEVFALLSSLYFQLGKWSRLQRLIETSVKHAFHVALRDTDENDNNNSNDDVRVSQHMESNNNVTDTKENTPNKGGLGILELSNACGPHNLSLTISKKDVNDNEEYVADTCQRCDTTQTQVDDPCDSVTATVNVAHNAKQTVAASVPTRKRVSRRVSFFGLGGDSDDSQAGDEDRGNHDPNDTTHRNTTIESTLLCPQHGQTMDDGRTLTRRTDFSSLIKHTAPLQDKTASPSSSDAVLHTAGENISNLDQDDFDFDELTGKNNIRSSNSNRYSQAELSNTRVPVTEATQVIYDMYGGLPIRLHRARDRRNFLTLVNVHAELLNERGQFAETVRLLEHAAACVQVPLLQLPPDLLVRLGMAYAFLGNAEQPCKEVFRCLRESCPMDSYADVLLDAAVGLCKVGMHSEALEMFTTLARYHQFCYDRLDLSSRHDTPAQSSNSNNDSTRMHNMTNDKTTSGSITNDTMASNNSISSNCHVDAANSKCEEEAASLRVILAAAYSGQADCYYALQQLQECEEALRRTLQHDPTHLSARLLLGKLLYYHRGGDVAGAVWALTPRDQEPALQRIQLGHALVHIYCRSGHYLAAIALGVVIFELLVQSAENESGGVGDADSVASGRRMGIGPSAGVPHSHRFSSQNSMGGGGCYHARGTLLLPTMSRASSAIVPASSLLDSIRNNTDNHAATGGGTASLRHSLAASIKASSVVYRQQRARQGRGALLTTTVYGASAAASVAAGGGRNSTAARSTQHHHRNNNTNSNNTSGGNHAANKAGQYDEDDEDAMKDRSAIFRFHRRRRRRVQSELQSTAGRATDAKEQPPRCRRRIDRARGEEDAGGTTMLATMPASAFWNDGVSDDTDGKISLPGRNDVNETDAILTHGSSGDSCLNRNGDESVAEPAHVADTASAMTARDCELADLEDFERVMTTMANSNEYNDTNSNNREDDDGDALTLPSLEHVSQQFGDPVMASLFLNAYHITAESTSATPNHDDVHDKGSCSNSSGANNIHTNELWASSSVLPSPHDTFHSPLTTSSYTVAAIPDRVTVKEVVAALGRRALIDLAVTLVDCYAALDRFNEAKEFAFLTLTSFGQKMSLRQVARSLEQPLRLAVLRAALASGQSEDAYRVGLRLLYDAGTLEERSTVVRLLHGVLNRCEDRSSILYRHILDGHRDIALLVLLANRYYQTRSFTRVLNLYLLAHAQRPMDIFLNFMVGLSFYLCSHQKKTREREACVSAGTVYFARYQTLLIASDPQRTGEALYNCARALHYLHLHYLCIPLYERIATHLCVPEECTRALQRASRVNLYFIYRWVTGNYALALSVLPHAT